ncbi:MAG: hypothetical protein ACRDDI_13520 [Aeromonas veronii]
MRDNVKPRISRNQREALFLLWVLEQRGAKGPVPFSHLLGMVNKNRINPVARQNFYAGLRTVRDHGLILIYRDRTLKLSAALTGDGREVAADIAAQMEE